MNTAVINIKVEPGVKKQAHLVADELGFSLSSLIHAFLKNLIKTRTITFSATKKEELSDYAIKALQESMDDIKKGRTSPTFTNAEDAIAWLNKPLSKKWK